MKIGVIGCGNICGIYFETLSQFPETEVVACADLEVNKSQRSAAKYSVESKSVEELLVAPDIGLILNLTVPKAHFEVSLAALEAGKHVYVEKPLAVEFEDGVRLIAEAEDRGLSVGCAPDTVLGAGIQTCRKLLDDGAIGNPVGANAFMLCPGHESWHPSPEFYYEKGGGPLFDMGPYYLTVLVTLLGPIKAVSGMARATWPQRTITSEPKRGNAIDVETPTHIVATLEFANGALVHLTTSFDVQRSTLPHIELYGTEGTIVVPDPNGFGAENGVIRLFRKGGDWDDMPLVDGFSQNSRGLGVLDQVQAIAKGRLPRASGQVGLHVLEAMQRILESAESGKRIELQTQIERPPAM